LRGKEFIFIFNLIFILKFVIVVFVTVLGEIEDGGVPGIALSMC